jgi:phage baseplate assembly protein W
MTMHVDFPFHFDATGRTATTDDADYLKDLITQLLLTRPGERPNRPDFGVGIVEHVFGPNGRQVAAALQAQLQGALQRQLADQIEVKDLRVESDDATLRVSIVYAKPPEPADVPIQIELPRTGTLV